MATAKEDARATQALSSDRLFMVLVYAVQFFFGGWFLFHGSNYFLKFFPQPSGSSPMSHELIGALIHSGLFDVVKGLEVIVGLALLANRFVPLACVLAFPVSFSISYVNLVANGDAFSVMVAVLVIAFNGLIALGHLDRFLPMLAFYQGDPSARGFAAIAAGGRGPAELDQRAGGSSGAQGGRPLRYWVHGLCVIGGIAAAAGSTMATTRPGGARSQQHYAQVEALAQAQAQAPGPSGAASAPQTPIPPANPPQTEAERKAAPAGDSSPKAVVNAFDQMAFFDGNPIAAMKKYLAEDFVERYPDMAVDGFANDKAAMIHFFETRGWKKGEHNTDTVYQVLADGQRVAVFHRVTTSPTDRGTAFVDIFRVQDGKIVEHWAVGQPISAKVSPRHSMF